MVDTKVQIVGQTVECFRSMTQEELEYEGWEDTHRSAFVLELSGGLKVYASMDDEGNGPGTLYWVKDGEGYIFTPSA